jgi:enoyl-CoA hydratase/carnithine racemase
MDAMNVPLVAAVNGDAAGGGATIALGADIRICSTATRFVFPFTRLGLCPEGGSTYRLPRLVGPSRSADWLLSGRRVDSAEALAAGLVTSVLPAEDVLPAAQRWAQQVAERCAPGAVATTRAMLRACPPDAATAAARESRAIVNLSAQPDCIEGVTAYLERREPRFTERLRVRAPW